MTSAIEVRGLTKQFGPVRAVDDLSFEVAEGRVTGFLGPNGSGKTTTLRMLLGLVSITDGTATFGGKRYVDLDHPIRHVGAALEATSFHPTRRAEDHLKTVAMASRHPAAPGWTRRSSWSGSPTWPDAGSASSRSACASACSSPPRCWATPRS